jgi:hypothetical protein
MLDKESLSTRRQIKYFTDEVPDENIIKHIIADTIAYAPVKNNRWDFILDVYDNSWDDQKQLLLYKTACNWLKRKDIIKHWTVDQHKEAAADTSVKSENYNHQVTAPYLIVARKSNRQYDPETGPDSRPDKKAVAAGSVAATLSFVTRQYGLYGGFCSCYTDSFNSTIPPNMIIPDKDNFYFMFGIGYPDEKFYKKYHNAYFPSEVQNMDLMYKRPTEDQVSEWM